MDWQIFGHDWAVNLLQAHAAGGKLRHAYLFIGPEGVGRQTMAIRFAQALNCRESSTPGQFCGTCRDCRQIAAMQHPDLNILLPEEGHRDILVDQIRALQHHLALAPYTGAYRIALLPDFQYATTEASNALLKTLEEPSDKVVLLLTANDLESLLPTIVSRCEVVRLRPVSIESAQEYLRSVKGLSTEKAKLIAHLTSGRIGAAIHYAEEPEHLIQREEILSNFLVLLQEKRVERFNAAEALVKPYEKAREKAGEVLPVWLSFWRDVFIHASGADVPLVNIDLQLQIEKIAANLPFEKVRPLVLVHEKALQQLELYANVRLLLESLMLQWPFVPEFTTH
jgi:DNA polymerase-3 subunit delta'